MTANWRMQLQVIRKVFLSSSAWYSKRMTCRWNVTFGTNRLSLLQSRFSPRQLSAYAHLLKHRQQTMDTRSTANILGIPLVKISNDALDDAVEMCWLNATRELIQFAEGKPVDLTKISIANTLPGKNKMSQEALNAIQKKTSDILSKLLPPR